MSTTTHCVLRDRETRLRPASHSRLHLDRANNLAAWQLWALCGWIGAVCGLVESGLHLGWRAFGQRVGDPDLWVNWNAPWLIPLSLAVWFTAIGVALSLVHHVAPRCLAWCAPYLLIALGVWSALTAIPGLHAWAVGLLVVGVASRLARHTRLDALGFRRLARRSLPIVCCAWFALFVANGLWPAIANAWSSVFSARPSAQSPNVFLIVLDTVRADHLQAYGYERMTSPNLERWARRGVRFNQARATTPYTLGTHASLFTGHWMFDTSARVNVALDGQHLTLAEELRGRGYATAGFVGNIFYGSARYGLDRGFSHYHDIPGNVTRSVSARELLRASGLGSALIQWFERKARVLVPMQRSRLDASELNREALAWIDRNRMLDRPFFVFLNYFDAHSPYSLPAEAPQPYSRKTADHIEAKLEAIKEREAHEARHPTLDGTAELDRRRAEAHALIRDAYDDGIAWIDRQLDALLAELQRRGLLDNSVVIVTADHGEMLGEHGLLGHGNCLYRPVVHVPLLVIDPSGRRVAPGIEVDRPVSVRDIPATIADLVGPDRSSPFPGQSLRRFWLEPEGAASDTPVLSEMEHLWWQPRTPRMPAAFGPMRAVTLGRSSFHRQEHETLGRLEMLFDLAADPNEECNLGNDPAHQSSLQHARDQLETANRQGRAR